MYDVCRKERKAGGERERGRGRGGGAEREKDFKNTSRRARKKAEESVKSNSLIHSDT